MILDNQTKFVLIFGVSLVLLYFLYLNNSSSEHMTNTVVPSTRQDNMLSQDMDSDVASVGPVSKDSLDSLPVSREYAPPESDWLHQKFNGRNRAKTGEYKNVSYDKGTRGDLGPSDWTQYFDHNNNIIGNASSGQNDQFLPREEASGDLAIFKSKGNATCGSNQNCDPEDLFNIEQYVPQEVNNDWFEVMPEPISVKNRHLINITKPIGVNTIGSSHKIANHDLRAQPVAPKFVVSPWNNSSVEPDLSLKPLF